MHGMMVWNEFRLHMALEKFSWKDNLIYNFIYPIKFYKIHYNDIYLMHWFT